jgi:anaerobic selenocysteine-containing dehydrogenase
LRAAAHAGRAAFREAFLAALQQDRALAGIAPVVLYRTLGETLADGAAAAAVLWAPMQMFAAREPQALARAGFAGAEAGEQLFDAVLAGHSGVVFAVDEADTSWQRMATADGRIQLAIPELLGEWTALGDEPLAPDAEYPLVLAAGERRDYTANTIYRDPDWRRKGRDGALRVNAGDAAALGLRDGGVARLRTRGGEALVRIEISARMQPGHVALPNGLGLDNGTAGESLQRTGVAPNELTRLEDRDAFAGTPWHKYVPARLEAV